VLRHIGDARRGAVSTGSVRVAAAARRHVTSREVMMSSGGCGCRGVGRARWRGTTGDMGGALAATHGAGAGAR